jgi:hypothetical protein
MKVSEIRKYVKEKVDPHVVVRVSNRQGKLYVKTIGIDIKTIEGILGAMVGDKPEDRWTPRQKVRMTIGSWTGKEFTFRINL